MLSSLLSLWKEKGRGELAREEKVRAISYIARGASLVAAWVSECEGETKGGHNGEKERGRGAFKRNCDLSDR